MITQSAALSVSIHAAILPSVWSASFVSSSFSTSPTSVAPASFAAVASVSAATQKESAKPTESPRPKVATFFPGLSGADRLRHPFLFQSVAAAVGAPRAVRLGRAARAEGTDPHLNFYFCDLIQFQNAAKKYNFGSE